MTRRIRLNEGNRRWWTLAAMCFALFMIMLDNTVVNVALPSIQDDLGASLSGLEWTVNIYTLTFAVLLVTGGRLGDILGRRHTMNWPGIGALSLGLTALVLSLVEGNSWGWGSPEIPGLLTIAGVALAAFALLEPRVREPMVDFSLMRCPTACGWPRAWRRWARCSRSG
jgi:MFS family permease